MFPSFHQPHADCFIPDNIPVADAFRRTTHLAIGAHQDDLEIFAYSAIAEAFAETGVWFGGVTVTDGAGSSRTGPYRHFSDAEMKVLRRREQRRAAEIGRYSFQVQLDYPSSAVKQSPAEAVVSDLHEILEAARPEVVYLHNPADKHATHVAVFARSLQALRRMPAEHRPRQVLGCEVWRSLDWLGDEEKIALDASRYPSLAATLLGVFDSQITGGKRYDLATIGRRAANATFFDSHVSDTSTALNFALDLTPLVINDTADITAFVDAAIERFRQSVSENIRQFC